MAAGLAAEHGGRASSVSGWVRRVYIGLIVFVIGGIYLAIAGTCFEVP